jgi:hypothetical protein
MFKVKVSSLVLLLLIITSCINVPVCYANSAEPPSILIIVPNSPKDLEISLGPGNIKAHRTDKVIESYYTFYRYDLKSLDYTVTVTTAGNSFDITLEAPPQSYNNIYTLDLNQKTITPGKSLFRSISLPALRIILTLLMEAAIFFLFGYRKKRSWIIFVIVNLVTQGVLNIWLSVSSAPLESYLVFKLVFLEILVFMIEMAAFLIFVKERGRALAFLYVLVANAASLFAGGYLITHLPI